MKQILLFTASILFLFSSTGCRKTVADETARYVPANASGVMVINMKTLYEKADWNAVKNYNFYKDFMAEAGNEMPPVIKAAFENPAESGIDLQKSGYGFVTINPDDMENVKGGFVLPLADAKKFEALLASAPGKAETEGNIKFVTAESGDMMVSHTDQVAILAFGDKVDRAWVKSLYEQGAKGSIASNEAFASVMKTPHDFVMWFSSNSLAEQLQKNPSVTSAFKMAGFEGDIVSDNVAAFYADFNQGDMTGGAEWNLNANLTKVLDPMFRDQVKTDFGKYIASKDLGMVLTFGASPAGIKEFINKGMLSFLLNQGMSEAGFNSEDLFTAFDGDMFVSAYTNATSTPDVVFGAKVGNEAAMKKIITSLSQGAPVQEVAGVTTIQIPEYKDGEMVMKDVNYFIHDGIFFVSTRKDLTDKIKGGGFSGGEQVGADVMKAVAPHVAGFYTFANFTSSMYNSTSTFNPAMAAVPEGLKDFITHSVTTIDRKGSKAVAYLKDASRNSLRILLDMADQAYLKDKENQKKEESTLEDMLREEEAATN